MFDVVNEYLGSSIIKICLYKLNASKLQMIENQTNTVTVSLDAYYQNIAAISLLLNNRTVR